MVSALEEMVALIKERSQDEQRSRILGAAVRLFPYISTVLPTPEEAQQFVLGGEITENDVTRALRAITIAVAMDGTIRARLNPDLIGRAHL